MTNKTLQNKTRNRRQKVSFLEVLLFFNFKGPCFIKLFHPSQSKRVRVIDELESAVDELGSCEGVDISASSGHDSPNAEYGNLASILSTCFALRPLYL